MLTKHRMSEIVTPPLPDQFKLIFKIRETSQMQSWWKTLTYLAELNIFSLIVQTVLAEILIIQRYAVCDTSKNLSQLLIFLFHNSFKILSNLQFLQWGRRLQGCCFRFVSKIKDDFSLLYDREYSSGWQFSFMSYSSPKQLHFASLLEYGCFLLFIYRSKFI